MYARLTKSFVDSQPFCNKGQLIIRDLDLKGFGLRVTPGCKAFIVEGRVDGTQRRYTMGDITNMSLDTARKEAQRILGDWKLGIDCTPHRKSMVPTLRDVMDRYLEERRMKPETKKAYRSLVERSMPDWLGLPITAITKEMVLKRHYELIHPTRCRTDNKACANGALQILRVFMRYAIDMYPESKVTNPTDALRWRWYKVQARQGVMPDGKLPHFYQAVMVQPKIARDFILFLLFTALRRNEAATLRWSDVNFEARTLTIEAQLNKSHRTHILPLTPIVMAILQSRWTEQNEGHLRSEASRKSEFIFPGRYEGHLNEPRAVLARLREHMGWHWLLHDLRRSCLSTGEKIGVPFLALQKIANHVIKRNTTDQYVVVDAEFVRPHLERINDRLMELMETSLEEWSQVDQQVSHHEGGQELQIKSVVIEEPEEEEIYV